jgi:hypothetical protein
MGRMFQLHRVARRHRNTRGRTATTFTPGCLRRCHTGSALGSERSRIITPNFIAVALFAALIVSGILDEFAPLWVVLLVSLAVGVAVFI